MVERPIRRFNMIDALVLIAATALGLMAIRLTWDEQTEHFNIEGDTRLIRTLSAAEHGLDLIRLVEPGLVAWTITLLVLRLRPPRPAWRCLMLQPGFVVGIVTLLMLFVALSRAILPCVAAEAAGIGCWKFLCFAIPVAIRSKPALATWAVIRVWVLEASSLVAPGVLSIWLVLAMGRRCRPERSWIDRAGRITGILWIIAAFSAQASSLLGETWFVVSYSASTPASPPEKSRPPEPTEPTEFEMPPLPESVESY